VANTLKLPRKGAAGFIVWLGLLLTMKQRDGDDVQAVQEPDNEDGDTESHANITDLSLKSRRLVPIVTPADAEIPEQQTCAKQVPANVQQRRQ